MAKETYSIGEISKKTGVSIRTLHFYDEKGLLQPEKHPTSGHRIYSEEDIKTLHQIMTLKFLGFSLDKIGGMLKERNFHMGLIDSLRMQAKKLEEDKERIEIALATIKRTIALLESEGEVDSNILMSIISSMQTEKEQREWAEKYFDKNVVEQIFEISEEEKLEWEKASVKFYKQVKSLAGRPADDADVQHMLREFFSAIAVVLDTESLREFVKIGNLTEEDSRKIEEEIDRFVPNPLTKEETEWLEQVMDSFLEKYDINEFLSKSK
ncbi:MAG TPA: MerR family transcriptional regulator [Bacillota bacterium]|nr:MerR family transcriptional regulator [Bacillota bacterium]